MTFARHRILALAAAVVWLSPGPALAQIHSVLVTDGLDRPVLFLPDPTMPNIQYIVEQGGRIRVLQNGHLSDDFLDLTDQVQQNFIGGLLGMAFAPDYMTSGRFYLNFTNTEGNTVIARFHRSADDPLRADGGSRFDFVWGDGSATIFQPYGDHNGGNMAFGPDGYLYVGLGDGGGEGDPDNHAQNPGSLLGKILRLDVSVPDDDSRGYVVPADNPFVNVDGVLPEIWALGLRNPWRWSFDDPARGGTGALILADVGQSAWEEVDFQPFGAGGRNYGWRVREGANDYNTSEPAFSEPLTEPIFQYSHDEGQCITGGFIYRGSALGSAYYGRYFFADFMAGRVWSMGLNTNPDTGDVSVTDVSEHSSEVADGADLVSSFGLDAWGELYTLSWGRGRLYRIAYDATPPTNLAPVAAGPTDIRLTWTAAAGATSYTVLRGTTPGGETVFATNVTDTTFADSTAVHGTRYFYRVAANFPSGPPGTSSEVSFRLTTVPADVNGDSLADLIWHSTSTGANAVWFMNSTTLLSYAGFPTVADPAWQLVATADINDDAHLDLLWRNVVTGANAVWYMSGTTLLSYGDLPTLADPAWQIVTMADMNQDGKPDILWRNVVTGANAVWYMNGTTLLSYGDLPTVTDPAWLLAGTGDFNLDGAPDLVWRNLLTGQNVVWLMNGVSVSASVDLPAVNDPAWSLEAVLDINEDGWADLIWRNTATGANVAWSMQGTTVVTYLTLPTVADQTWQLIGRPLPEVPVDINGDRHTDLVWRNTATGANMVWYLNGAQVLGQVPILSVPDVAWQIVAEADLNRDGHPDLIWRNATTGEDAVWYMNGTAILESVSLPTVADTSWRIVAAVDMDGDRHPDLVWRNATTGADAVWYLNGTELLESVSLPTVADTTWQIVAASDVNGDARNDLIWRNTATGDNAVWYMNNTTVLSYGAFAAVADVTWQIVGSVDVNGDGHPDLIWRNIATGSNAIWYLNGTTLLDYGSLMALPDLNWVLR